jgi:hypothetical protein
MTVAQPSPLTSPSARASSLCRTQFPPQPSLRTNLSSVRRRALTLDRSYCCGLFVVAKKVNSFGIKQIQTLCVKHRGWGTSRKQFRLSRFGFHVFSPLCFHHVTNPFFRNSFAFTSIQNPRGVGCGGLLVRSSERTRNEGRLHQAQRVHVHQHGRFRDLLQINIRHGAAEHLGQQRALRRLQQELETVLALQSRQRGCRRAENA